MAKRSDTIETVLLALELLRRIPRNSKVSAPELHKQLAGAGVARDLRVSGCEKARKYGFQAALLGNQGFVVREYGVGGVTGVAAGQHVGIRTARRARRCRCA